MAALFVISEILIIETAGHKMADLTVVSFAAFKSNFFCKKDEKFSGKLHCVYNYIYVIFYYFNSD